jgi:hypothetical protein
VIVTKQGKEPLGDYMRRKQREGTSVQYSLLVPSYNEQKRLPNMLPKTIEVPISALPGIFTVNF